MNPDTTQTNTGMGGGRQYSPDQFAQTIKDRYPQYKNVDNTTLAQKMVAKYPQYASRVNFNQLPPPPQPRSFLDNIGNTINTAGSNVYDAISGQGQYAGQGAIQRGFGAVSEASSAPLNVAADIIPGGRQALGAVSGAFSGVVNWLGDKIGSTQMAQDFVTKHPDAAKTLEGMANVGQSAGNIAGNILMAKGGSEAIKKGVETAPKIGEMAGKVKENISSRLENRANTRAGAQIDEMIAPKPTNTQAKLAQSEGRLIKGKDRTFFRSSQPDTVIPADKTVAARNTILKNIPNAAKMDSSELATAVKENVAKTAQSLRPVMERTPIQPTTVEKINAGWEALKRTQIEKAPATEEANVAKRQASFEKLLQKSGSGHMGDLWDTTQHYDNSIAENVKKANVNSPESLWNQKQEWLQNRRILTEATHNVSTGLNETSSRAFKEMSDLYEAKHNLQTTAKIEKGGKPSVIKQAYNSRVGRATRNVVKYGVGGKLLLDEFMK